MRAASDVVERAPHIFPRHSDARSFRLGAIEVAVADRPIDVGMAQEIHPVALGRALHLDPVRLKPAGEGLVDRRKTGFFGMS